MGRLLRPEFYQRDTITVAKELLGSLLVHVVRGRRISGIIVETEAYLGVEDPAAHTYGGRNTQRVRSMYLAGGHAYVYFVYGMHFCFNVVTREKNVPQAVLIRALEPVEGIPVMRRNRGIDNDLNLASGPAKLCQALAIDRQCDGLILKRSSGIFIEEKERGVGHVDLRTMVCTPRIGVDYAGNAAQWPLRFTLC